MERDPAAGQASYSAEQFAPLFAAEDRHFWFRSRNRCIAAALRSLPDFAAVQDVLEVGCGTGVVLAELQRLFPTGRVIGMDLFAEGIEFARRRFSGPLIQGDVFQYEFDRPFDLIGAFDVIEHLDDDRKILERFRQQLKPGGHLILTVPAHMSLWSYFDEVAHHRRRYTGADLRAKLTAAGFEIRHVTQFMSVLYPIMWIKRRVIGEEMTRLSQGGHAEQQAAVESDLRIHPLVNGICNFLLRPEAGLIARRIKIPWGTSLLAVATRPADGDNQNHHA